MEAHGQLVITRRIGEEIILLDADGRELARVRIAGHGDGRVRVGVRAVESVRILRAECLPADAPTAPPSKWDLIDVAAAAEVAGETVAGFLGAVDRHELPPPATRWRPDGRGGWEGCPRWQRGGLLAAVANRTIIRRNRFPGAADVPPHPPKKLPPVAVMSAAAAGVKT